MIRERIVALDGTEIVLFTPEEGEPEPDVQALGFFHEGEENQLKDFDPDQPRDGTGQWVAGGGGGGEGAEKPAAGGERPAGEAKPERTPGRQTHLSEMGPTRRAEVQDRKRRVAQDVKRRRQENRDAVARGEAMPHPKLGVEAPKRGVKIEQQDPAPTPPPAPEHPEPISIPAEARTRVHDSKEPTDRHTEDHLKAGKITGIKALGGGVSGSFLVTLQDGSKAVWKPEKGESNLAFQNYQHGFQTEREVTAWEVAKALGYEDLGSPCVEHNSEIGLEDRGKGKFAERDPNGHGPDATGEGRGALMAMQPGAAAANSPAPYDGRRDRYRMALYDTVIGNTDRHQGNWMVTPDGKLRAIDHGYSFPDKEPEAKIREGDFGRILMGDLAKMEKGVANPFNFKELLREISGRAASLSKSAERLKKISPEAHAGVMRRYEMITKSRSPRELRLALQYRESHWRESQKLSSGQLKYPWSDK